MKYQISLMLITVQLLINSFSMGQNAPTVTDSVNLQKYAGKWYEIASYPMKFQKDCYCVTADYTLTNKGYVKVFNSCRKGSVNGQVKSITGKAFPVKGTNNVKLKVQFFWPFRADYWVIDKDEDYSWAVVSGASRKYLWILCRTPEMQKETWQYITDRLVGNGFDLSKLKRMVHKGNQ
ncbi:MAG: lipocalin family protein [Lentimicrobiaceae bacterium]